MEVICIPIIISLVYGIIELLKITIKSEKFLNFVPLLSAFIGIALAVIAFYAAPNLIPTNNLLYAVFLGFSSGLSATGSNQIVKQMQKIYANPTLPLSEETSEEPTEQNTEDEEPDNSTNTNE